MSLTTIRNAAVDAVRAALVQRAAYAEATVSGDPVKLESGGFSLKGHGSPTGTPGQVLNLSATAGDADSQIDLHWDPVSAAKAYEIQVSVDPITGTSWMPRSTVSPSKATIGGLTSGTRLWFRARAVGTKDTFGPWSDPATKIVP